MTIKFFDSHPGLMKRLKSMDHSSKEYRKLLPKLLFEIGGIPQLFVHLKESEEGNQFRKKYFRELIISGIFIASMFAMILVTYLLTGGRDTNQFNSTDVMIFIGFLVSEVALVTFSMVFAFKGRKVLLSSLSHVIDNYPIDENVVIEDDPFLKFKNSKRTLIVASVTFIVVFTLTVLGIGYIKDINANQTKSFSKAGMSITLTNGFQEKDMVTMTASYVSAKRIVYASKYEFPSLEASGITADSSVDKYMEFLLVNNDLDSEVTVNDGISYFIYSEQINGKSYTYFTTVKKSNDAFWVFNFVCETHEYEKTEALFVKWAKSIVVG